MQSSGLPTRRYTGIYRRLNLTFLKRPSTMKRSIIILLFAIAQLFGTTAKAQNNPGQPASLSNNPNLVLLGKIWGLLKYHHPSVIKGTYNWDDELIKILPDYNACKNVTGRN